MKKKRQMQRITGKLDYGRQMTAKEEEPCKNEERHEEKKKKMVTNDH